MTANDPNPVVSIIVPARNEEACLGTCLQSLITQTGIDYEIMVVDDDSTDRTAEIARSFAITQGITRNAPADADATGNATNGKGTACSRAENNLHKTNGTAEGRALAQPEDARENDASASSREARGSTTHAEAALQARPDLTLITAPPLPASWAGKNNAMATGAKIAKGKWLLFTDADTVHKPGSLARAVAEAEAHGASLLSYSPEQEVRSLWEKAVMPVIFAELATTYPPQAVNDPASPIAAANGQYLMISREAYDAVGGHAPIANNLLEDVAMARLIKSSGRKIFFRYGGDAVRTRMYRSWPQMKEGWTKNLALLFPHPVALALLRAAEFVLILANLAVAVWAGLSGRSNLALQATLLTIILTGWFWLRIRKAHFSFVSNLLALGGLPIFARLLLRSASLHRKQAVTWKGRTYRGLRPELSSRRERWSSYLSSAPVASESFMEVEDPPAQERQL
jgi:glycosyltransferase involved in cell wall biosynthesis